MSTFPPTSEAAWHAERGRLLLELGRPREALVEWQRAHACQPEDAYFCGSIARCYLKLDLNEDAFRAASQAVALDPENGWCHRLCFYTLHDLGRSKEALQAAGRAAMLDPDQPLALHCLGDALLDLKRLEEAKVVVQRLLTLAPDDASSWVLEARLAKAEGRVHDAESIARHALSLDPQSLHGFWCLGEALWRQKRYRDAYQAYDDALCLCPQDAFMRNLIIGRCQERCWPRKAVVLFCIARFAFALLAWLIVFAETGRWYCALLSSGVLLFTSLPISCEPYWYAFLWRRGPFLEIPRAARLRWWQGGLCRTAQAKPHLPIGLFVSWLVLVILWSVRGIPRVEPPRSGTPGFWGWSLLVFAACAAADIVLTVYLDRTGGMAKGEKCSSSRAVRARKVIKGK